MSFPTTAHWHLAKLWASEKISSCVLMEPGGLLGTGNCSPQREQGFVWCREAGCATRNHCTGPTPSWAALSCCHGARRRVRMLSVCAGGEEVLWDEQGAEAWAVTPGRRGLCREEAGTGDKIGEAAAEVKADFKKIKQREQSRNW